MYVVSVTPRNVPLRNVTARQLSNVLQWNLRIVDMLEVVIILYIYIHCSERGSLHGGFSYHMYTPIVLPTCTYTCTMYMCVSIEAADVCLQCTRTMCNIECCRFTTVKESSVCYTYIIQEDALVKGFYLRQHSLTPRDHTHLCGKGPFLHKWVWCLGTRLPSTHVHAH